MSSTTRFRSAARAIGATRVDGSGDAAVVDLDDVTVDAPVFLADGRIVGHLPDPTAVRVGDTIKRLGR